MMNNGGGYYPSLYGSTPFTNISNNYNIGAPSIPPYYHSTFPQQQQQQQQQQSQHRPIDPQNSNNPPPSFKLYDLDTNNHNEIIRLLFSYAGVSFKDKRIKQDEWNKVKEQMSVEELPILRINNQFRIFHSHAIIRYLAREFHLYGTGQYDHAIVDMILETIRPLREKIFQQLNNNEEKLHNATIYFKQLENFYAIFNRSGPFYLGSHISLADLIVYDTINSLIKIDTKLLDNYSHLKGARRRLEKHPRISDYIHTKTNQQMKISLQKSSHSHRHGTKSPTPVLTSHHHHHRHHSHDDQSSEYHHHHHHHRRHSKEPTPLLQTKRSIRSSKSPSIPQKDKEPTDIIPPPPPVTTEQKSESTID